MLVRGYVALAQKLTVDDPLFTNELEALRQAIKTSIWGAPALSAAYAALKAKLRKDDPRITIELEEIRKLFVSQRIGIQPIAQPWDGLCGVRCETE